MGLSSSWNDNPWKCLYLKIPRVVQYTRIIRAPCQSKKTDKRCIGLGNCD